MPNITKPKYNSIAGTNFIEQQAAWDILTLAAAGNMPDSYWTTDQRIRRACRTLIINPVKARDIAREFPRGFTL